MFLISLLRHGFLISSYSFLARIRRYGALDTCNLSVAHSNQVTCRKKTAFVVVCGHETQVGVVVVSVNEDDGEIIVVDAFDERTVGAAWDSNDSVNSS